MRSSWTRLSAVLVALLSAAVIVGCGSSNSSSSTTTSSSAASPSTTSSTTSTSSGSEFGRRRAGAGRDQVKGHADRRRRRDVRADGVRRIGRKHGRRHGSGSGAGARGRDGPQDVHVRQRHLRHESCRASSRRSTTSACSRSPTPRHAEDRRLRRLLHGRRVVLHQGLRRGDDQHDRPTCAATRSPSSKGTTEQADATTQSKQVQGRRQARRSPCSRSQTRTAPTWRW